MLEGTGREVSQVTKQYDADNREIPEVKAEDDLAIPAFLDRRVKKPKEPEPSTEGLEDIL